MRAATLITLCGTSLLLGACSGGGNYTREGASLANERMSVMKSATEWEMGRQAFLSGDLEKALRKVNASLSLNEGVTKSHVLKGRIMIEMGELGQALKSLHTAETLDPQDPDAQYYVGIVFERLNRPEEAAEHFMNAAELDDYNPGHAVAAAEMLVDLDRVDEAREYLLGMPMAGENAGIRQMLGHIALINDDAPRAVEYFGQARLLAPDDAAIQENLVRAQMLVGQFAQAEMNIAALRKADKLDARRDLKLLHAEALLAVNRPVEARTMYQELLNDPDMVSDVSAWIGLGNSAYLVGDQRTLRRAASRVVSLAPSSHEGYALWALCHRREGDFAKALSSIDTAIERDGNNPSFFAMKAMILSNLDRTAEAVQVAKVAARLAPEDPSYASLIDQLRTGTFASVPTE
jgi:Flp pilus assembly protein TadD